MFTVVASFVPAKSQLRRSWGAFRNEKNHLFAGNDAGARRLAVLVTVVVNCEPAGLDTFAYLRDVLTKIAAGRPNARRAELLPRASRAHQAAAHQ